MWQTSIPNDLGSLYNSLLLPHWPAWMVIISLEANHQHDRELLVSSDL